MKIKFRKEVDCAIMIRDVTGWYWKLASTFKEVQFAIDMAESILKERTVWNPEDISTILIVDVNTDEILIEVNDDDSNDLRDDICDCEPDWDHEDEDPLIAPWEYEDEDPLIAPEDKGLEWLYGGELPF